MEGAAHSEGLSEDDPFEADGATSEQYRKHIPSKPLKHSLLPLSRPLSLITALPRTRIWVFSDLSYGKLVVRILSHHPTIKTINGSDETEYVVSRGSPSAYNPSRLSRCQ